MTKSKRKSENQWHDTDFKRPRTDKTPAGQGRVDPTYGQRSAIPGLDDYSMEEFGDGELEYGDGEDDGGINVEALKYLRAVRQEASSIPNLLVAPKAADDRSIYDTGLGDSRGYYHDGAYTAAPISDPSVDQAASPYSDAEDGLARQVLPQEAYYTRLLDRYSTIRTCLSAPPPRAIAETLPPSSAYPSYIGASASDYAAWRRRIRNTEPLPGQLANMNRVTVLKLLGLCTKELGDAISKRYSGWIWGLLARLPERGEMASEEIGVVRELGKRAVWLGVKMKGDHDLEVLNEESGGECEGKEEDEVLDMVEDMYVDHEQENIDDNEEIDSAAGAIGPIWQPGPNSNTENIEADENSVVEGKVSVDELSAAKARILQGLNGSTASSTHQINLEEEIAKAPVPEIETTQARLDEVKDAGAEATIENTQVTIDMIITIVGEFYGQRDLLEFRTSWT